MKWTKLAPLKSTLTYSLGVSGYATLLWLAPAKAMGAEQLILKYGPLQRSLPISALESLAETGQPNPELALYLALAQQSPERLRQGLTEPITITPGLLDRALSHPLGKVALSEMGRYLHPPSNEANGLALRAALLQSASGDNTLTLLEVLRNYPTREVTVEGDKILATYRQVNQWVSRAKSIWPQLQSWGLPFIQHRLSPRFKL